MNKIEALKTCFGALGALSILAGVIYGTREYDDALTRDRVERSFEYYRVFDSQQMLKVREGFLTAVESAYMKANDRKKEETLQDDDYMKIVTDELEKSPTWIYVDFILEYFDSVEQCVEMNECDSVVIDELLRKPTQFYGPFLVPIVLQVRKEDTGRNDYGLGLQKLGKRFDWRFGVQSP